MSKKKNNGNQVVLEKEETSSHEAISVSTENEKETKIQQKTPSTNAENKQGSKTKTETKNTTPKKKTFENKVKIEKGSSLSEQKENKKKAKTKDVSLNAEEKIEIDDKKSKVADKKTEINEEKQTKTVDSLGEKKSHKIVIASCITFATILLLCFLFSIAFALASYHRTTIMNGISIQDVDVSGLTKEQAVEKVSNALNEKLKKAITLKHNEYEVTVFPEQFDISFSVEDAVNMAYAKGRTR